MIDAHYDLLSICYYCYIHNDYSKIERFASEIRQSEVKCIFANLYFQSQQEMNDELGTNYYREDVSILDMFRISKAILQKYLPDTEFIYSIEGCDYLKKEDLEPLYNEGLRSILLVWNTKSRYGSGIYTDSGLTLEGKEFLERAIDLGIGIDLSHANQPTFFGMIDVIKENQALGKSVICYASHSNANTLHYKLRNLTDEQLLALKEVGGLVGVLTNAHFVSCGTEGTKEEQQRQYIEHLIYIESIVGKDKVMLSTDNMTFMEDYDPDYGLAPIYNYVTMKSDIEKGLLKYYNAEDTYNILYGNAYNEIVSKLQYTNKKTHLK